MRIRQNRRRFLATASLAATGIAAARGSRAAEGVLETTTIRLHKWEAICFAPLYVIETFLRTEGFTDVQWLTSERVGLGGAKLIADGDVDFDINFAGAVVRELDAGVPLTAVGGLHVGCYELFAREPIRTIGDLRGRRVAVHNLMSGDHLYVASMAVQVGLDPTQDIEWVSADKGALEAYAAGETDAFLGFPPEPQALRARGHTRVIVNTVLDRPWSQYFCCIIYGNSTWVRDHPVATKRFLRAIYRAAEFCTAEPAAAARQLVAGGFAGRYDHTVQTIQEIRYDLWHEYDAEDTMRFFALRLHEAGMIESDPNTLIAGGTDWRLVEALKQEMKT